VGRAKKRPSRSTLKPECHLRKHSNYQKLNEAGKDLLQQKKTNGEKERGAPGGALQKLDSMELVGGEKGRIGRFLPRK